MARHEIPAGIALLVLGAEALVRGASRIAAALGITPLVIGLTVVAFGTSAPELSVTVMASLNGQPGLAIGNVVGSNIFNVLFILGIAAMAGGGIPVMVAVALACLPIFFTGHRLDRWEGLVFFLYYGAYTAYLVLAGMRHASLETLSTAMIWFVMPITLLTLTLLAARELRSRPRSTPESKSG